MLTKLVHTNDPVTSKEAIAALETSGSRANHLRLVYVAVKAYPGLTACELMAHTGLDEYQIRRRLTDLKNEGKIKRGSARACLVKGSKNVTWSCA